MVEASFGLVFGFTVFLFAVAVFLVGLIIYLIVRKCRKTKEHQFKDILGDDIENVKTEPDGASWESPMAEFDEAISYAENSLPREHDTKPVPESSTSEPNIDEPIPEEVEPNIDEPIPEEAEPNIDEPIPEEEESALTNVKEEQDKTGIVIQSYERTMSEESDGPVYAKVQDHLPEVTDEKPIYSKVQEDSTVDEKPSGKLYLRVSFYESTIESSSLVRPSKKNKLEGIKTKVVSGLVTEFESSDKILIGRQITKDIGSSYIPKKKSVEDSVPDGHLDSDTGEPLYSVPNLAKKSSRKSIGPKVVVEDKSHDGDDDSEVKSPGVPPKVLGL